MKIEEVEDEPPKIDEKLESAVKMLKHYVQARDEGIAPKNSELEALLSAMKQGSGTSLDDITFPKNATDRANSETITPKPFFVIKAMTNKSEKIFINICASPKIPAPAEWEGGIPKELEETVKSDNESEPLKDLPNIRFPVGNPVVFFDLVYNSSIVELTMSNKKMKVFLVEMAMTWISQKYELELSSDFRLPNMKYKGGNVAPQQIRVSPTGPLVSEIPSESDLDPSFPLVLNSESVKPKVQARVEPSISTSKDQVSQKSTSRGGAAKPSNDRLKEMASTSSSKDQKNLAESETPLSSVHKQTSDDQIRLPDQKIPGNLDVPMRPPQVEMTYNFRPVEAVLVSIFLPQVKLENLQVSVTHTVVYINMKFQNPFEVALSFCTEPSNVDAKYNSVTHFLTLQLPFVPYSKTLLES